MRNIDRGFRKQIFSIRKLTLGTVSVAVGIFLCGAAVSNHQVAFANSEQQSHKQIKVSYQYVLEDELTADEKQHIIAELPTNSQEENQVYYMVYRCVSQEKLPHTAEQNMIFYGLSGMVCLASGFIILSDRKRKTKQMMIPLFFVTAASAFLYSHTALYAVQSQQLAKYNQLLTLDSQSVLPKGVDINGYRYIGFINGEATHSVVDSSGKNIYIDEVAPSISHKESELSVISTTKNMTTLDESAPVTTRETSVNEVSKESSKVVPIENSKETTKLINKETTSETTRVTTSQVTETTKVTTTQDMPKEILYHVSYQFTAEKELPQVLKERVLYTSQQVKNETILTTKEIDTSDYNDIVNDGIWHFIGWDKTIATVNKADVVFTGMWQFTPNTYKIQYAFEKDVNSSFDLPQSLRERLNGKTQSKVENGTSVTTDMIDTSDYVDTVHHGLWTFVEWTKTSEVVNKADVTVIGTWTFKENPVPELYAITYRFQSDTQDEVLPESVIALTPSQQTVAKGNAVTLIQPTEQEKRVEGGKWVFKGYAPTSLTHIQSDTEVVGTWHFEKNQYAVQYVFKSATEGKILPVEVNALKPHQVLVPHGQIFSPSAIDDTITTDEGVWTFVGYEPTIPVTVTQNTVFTGTWQFTPKSANRLYVNTNATQGGNGTEESPYNTLQKALTSTKEGDTIVLLSDVNLATSMANQELTIDKSITIDGRGHTIYGRGLSYSFEGEHTLLKDITLSSTPDGSNALYIYANDSHLIFDNVVTRTSATINSDGFTLVVGSHRTTVPATKGANIIFKNSPQPTEHRQSDGYSYTGTVFKEIILGDTYRDKTTPTTLILDRNVRIDSSERHPVGIRLSSEQHQNLGEVNVTLQENDKINYIDATNARDSKLNINYRTTQENLDIKGRIKHIQLNNSVVFFSKNFQGADTLTLDTVRDAVQLASNTQVSVGDIVSSGGVFVLPLTASVNVDNEIKGNLNVLINPVQFDVTEEKIYMTIQKGSLNTVTSHILFNERNGDADIYTLIKEEKVIRLIRQNNHTNTDTSLQKPMISIVDIEKDEDNRSLTVAVDIQGQGIISRKLVIIKESDDSIVKELPMDEHIYDVEVQGLEANTPYKIRLEVIYDLNDGKGTQTIIDTYMEAISLP
ncbi:YSIRK-type signal peptide-containing protein [Granulicatella sp. zg-ZJ]|uniref:SHIRT domain-containing protein n=1 Tax=Granulicatella sp. zg-ZJ TaxID=2678504 RepID=UPI0013D6D971|nr:SHIRT domain-containing protein [Granulicatella sp. zg-ZJ]NEW63479.1 YSIRK-type signal peptide-containing protein [Granulicatella sp. zg-ZJ]